MLSPPSYSLDRLQYWAAQALINGYVFDINKCGKYIYPCDIVAIAALSHNGGMKGHKPKVILPIDAARSTYLQRIEFIETLESCNTLIENKPDRQINKYPNHSLTELINVGDQGIADIIGILLRYGKDHLLGYADHFHSISELIINIDQHASHTREFKAQAFVHAQIYSNRIEVAAADLGVGILHSLRSNPQHTHISSAKEAFIEIVKGKGQGVSRVDDTDRGYGIRSSVSHLREVQGELSLISDDAHVYLKNGKGTITSLPFCFPGTALTLRIPPSRKVTPSA